jgi:hypothetical protein
VNAKACKNSIEMQGINRLIIIALPLHFKWQNDREGIKEFKDCITQ